MLSIRYLPSKPLFRMPGLSIRGLGIHETMPPAFVERPKGTGDYLFMVFHDPVLWGKTTPNTEIQAGSIVMWNRGASHFYGNPNRTWTHSWIHCDGQFVAKTLRDAHIRCDQPIRLSDPSRITRYLFDLHEEITGLVKPDRVIICNTLVNLIRDVARSESRAPHQPIPESLARARKLLDTNYHERITLKRLASDAHMSVPYLCSEFHRYFGMPPITYLIERRLKAAATLLRVTALAVGEIGRRVGYDDPYYFSKHFKSAFGVPPSQLRNRRHIQR